jgi:hypothetical protein
MRFFYTPGVVSGVVLIVTLVVTLVVVIVVDEPKRVENAE